MWHYLCVYKVLCGNVRLTNVELFVYGQGAVWHHHKDKNGWLIHDGLCAGNVLCGYADESEQRLTAELFLSDLKKKHGVPESLVIFLLIQFVYHLTIRTCTVLDPVMLFIIVMSHVQILSSFFLCYLF